MTPFEVWSQLPRTEFEHYPTWDRLQQMRFYEHSHGEAPCATGPHDVSAVIRQFFYLPHTERAYMEWLEREFLNPLPVKTCAHCDQPLHDPEQPSPYCSPECAGLARLDIYGDEEC